MTHNGWIVTCKERPNGMLFYEAYKVVGTHTHGTLGQVASADDIPALLAKVDMERLEACQLCRAMVQ